MLSLPTLALPDAVARLTLCVRRDHGAGQPLGAGGARVVSVIARGAVAVFVHPPGRSKFALEILGPGAIAMTGSQTDLLSADSWLEAVTLTATSILQVPRNVFEHETASDPAFAAAVVASLHRQYRAVAEHRLLLQLRPTARVAAALLFLQRQMSGDGATSTSLAITQDVVAGTAGLSRQTTNQALRSLQRTEAVTVSRAQIALRDPERLRAIASAAASPASSAVRS